MRKIIIKDDIRMNGTSRSYMPYNDAEEKVDIMMNGYKIEI